MISCNISLTVLPSPTPGCRCVSTTKDRKIRTRSHRKDNGAGNPPTIVLLTNPLSVSAPILSVQNRLQSLCLIRVGSIYQCQGLSSLPFFLSPSSNDRSPGLMASVKQ